jgi:hypothetical protein
MAAPSKRSAVFALATAIAGIPVACGGAANSDIGGSRDGGAYVIEDGSGGSFLPMGDAGISPDAFAGCAATAVEAQELPLDLYFMIDTSGSMNDLVGKQKSKWNAVSAAMTAFVNDPASAGIGMGLQYFPLTQQGVPTSCTSSAQCGSAGPCFFNTCATGGSSVIPCDTPADCPLGESCVPVGQCRYDHNTVCPLNGGQCGPDANNFDLGPCDAFTTSTCAQGDSCATADYGTPAVPIGLLPGNASALDASLAAQKPNGNTPTVAALQGAVDLAKTYAINNPGHSVVAVLATDGIPDECTNQPTVGGAVTEVANVAAAGLAGTPRIKTFAIGVFTPDAIASGTSALNQVASAGGTSKAFIINSTSNNVAAQFTAALNSIRGASLPCEYQVPIPDSGMADFTRVNVEYTTGAGVSTGIPYVQSSSRCGSSTGWYYDVDPMTGATPSAIFVCPSTCTTLGADTKGRVDVVIGCQTIAR